MNTNCVSLIQKVAIDILRDIPNRPFLCLQLSALLYANLKDEYGIDAKLVTGNLSYNEKFIFRQDFYIFEGDYSKFNLWAGHAWVEVENTLWDLSFFRSLYSEKFIKPYKNELLQLFGTGKGYLVLKDRKIPDAKFEYHPIELLTDDLATRIIKGLDTMLDTEW